MDIREFRTVNPISVNFKGLDLTYNADAFTGDFLRRAAAKFRELFGQPMPKPKKRIKSSDMVELTARTLEETASRIDRTRDYFASLLAGTPDIPVLMSWDLTDGDTPVPCTEDGLKCLEGRIVQEMYETIRDHPLPKSPEILTTSASQTISETTAAGSPTQEIQPVENLSM